MFIRGRKWKCESSSYPMIKRSSYTHAYISRLPLVSTLCSMARACRSNNQHGSGILSILNVHRGRGLIQSLFAAKALTLEPF
jgi:hypothetical protein